jgi:hypothetical protein
VPARPIFGLNGTNPTPRRRPELAGPFHHPSAWKGSFSDVKEQGERRTAVGRYCLRPPSRSGGDSGFSIAKFVFGTPRGETVCSRTTRKPCLSTFPLVNSEPLSEGRAIPSAFAS